ncbi:hypothetical protein [Clostridium sp. HMP27]|uniref:hypothetical protein n=1 Tax=Clostridium sp. HMP27 TaxID=1487921 RepID=UPI00052C4FD3|nr:hypothetical protein [Clostridium sp. HMP27]KGK90138.1 hypothetical protein DP68_01575 [Clostridium sp. HMP27]
MIIQWIPLLITICFLAFSYYKRYSLKTRLLYLGALFIVSLILVLPIFGFSIMTLWGAFLIERIWILLTAVLFIETAISKKSRMLRIILGVISFVIYLYLRTFI